jgi:hypothetical protein
MPSAPAKPELGMDERFGSAPILSSEKDVLKLAVRSAPDVEGTKPFPPRATVRSVLHK